MYIYIYIYIYICAQLLNTTQHYHALKKVGILLSCNSHIIFDEITKFFSNIFSSLKFITVLQLTH